MKLTEKQKKLLVDHLQYIKKNVNYNYRTKKGIIKKELYNYAVLTIAEKMNTYDENRSKFPTFINNILEHSLKNEYYRKIKNFHFTSNMNNVDSRKLNEFDNDKLNLI